MEEELGHPTKMKSHGQASNLEGSEESIIEIVLLLDLLGNQCAHGLLQF